MLDLIDIQYMIYTLIDVNICNGCVFSERCPYNFMVQTKVCLVFDADLDSVCFCLRLHYYR